MSLRRPEDGRWNSPRPSSAQQFSQSQASFWSRRNVSRPPTLKERWKVEQRRPKIELQSSSVVRPPSSTSRKLVSASFSFRPLQFKSWKTTSTCGFVSKLRVPFSPPGTVHWPPPPPPHSWVTYSGNVISALGRSPLLSDSRP